MFGALPGRDNKCVRYACHRVVSEKSTMVGTLSKIAAFFGSKSSLSTSSAYPSAYSVHVSSRVEEDLPLPRLRRASVFASFRVNKKWRGESYTYVRRTDYYH